MAVRCRIGPNDLLHTDPDVLDAMVELLRDEDKERDREARRARLRAARGR